MIFDFSWVHYWVLKLKICVDMESISSFISWLDCCLLACLSKPNQGSLKDSFDRMSIEREEKVSLDFKI